MTARDAIDIIRESPLWTAMSVKEKTEAISHAMEVVEISLTGDRYEDNVCDIVGEIYKDPESYSAQ